MIRYQNAILDPIPRSARYLFFSIAPGGDPGPALKALAGLADDREMVVGLGQSLVSALGHEVPGLRVFPPLAGPGIDVPSTSAALWCWLRGDDRGELVHRTRQVAEALAPGLRLARTVDAFSYRTRLDLSGYEDGTENPQGDAAMSAAFVGGAEPGLAGSSFAAVQQWLHDFGRLDAIDPDRRDLLVGRRREGNEEIEDAPASAHVKRTAQESFDPAAFVVRRSMPWADAQGAGLLFVAFGRSLDAFEAQLRRMVGAEDGVTDGLFEFTRPVSGAYFWCPPMSGGRLDLSLIGF